MMTMGESHEDELMCDNESIKGAAIEKKVAYQMYLVP